MALYAGRILAQGYMYVNKITQRLSMISDAAQNDDDTLGLVILKSRVTLMVGSTVVRSRRIIDYLTG